MKVAINGFGRIGRYVFKLMMENDKFEVVAINDLANIETLAHLLKYDSVHGRFNARVSFLDDYLIVNDKRIQIISEKDPSKLPWKKLEIDIVLEATGLFRSRKEAEKHLKAGAKKTIITAPASGNLKTIVIGVNDNEILKEDKLLSNASCTTNCLAPMIKLMNDKFGIEKGYMSTVHAYTADQNIQDAPHKDLRRARAAAYSIIPTTTGATQAVVKVIPSMEGKLQGKAIRVPVPAASLIDLTLYLDNTPTRDEVNNQFEKSSENEMKGIVEYSNSPLVSIDIVGNSHSCVFDSLLTTVNDNMINIVAWYDNEAGYSNRLIDLMLKLN